MLLTRRGDIPVVGEASNFLETIQKTTELHPDLIILELNQPDRDRMPSTEQGVY
jgi:chemotaxis response regulator CheB